MKTHNWRKIALWVLAAAALVALLVLFWPTLTSITAEDIIGFTPASPFLAALVLIGIYCAKNVLMVLPIVALYLAAGILFPSGIGILVTYIGLACELTIGYFAGRRIGQKRVRAMIDKRPKAGAFFAMVERNDTTACFITRALPMPMPVPIDVVSLFYGASGVPFAKYITFSLLGLTPFMIPFVLAGRSLDNIFSAQFLVPFGISAAVTLAAFLLYTLLAKKSNPKAE